MPSFASKISVYYEKLDIKINELLPLPGVALEETFNEMFWTMKHPIVHYHDVRRRVLPGNINHLTTSMSASLLELYNVAYS